MSQEVALSDRIEAKTAQLDRIEQISGQIKPYLHEVMDRLRRFYDNDLPVLPGERQRRIDNLAQMMAEPEAAVSEKLRKIMEALMIEAESGHTIEVYRDTVEIAEQPTLVDIFRLGRIALFYQSLDGRNCGFYNVAEGACQPLPKTDHDAVRAAMEIGAKRRPAELLSLPIGRLKVQ